VTTPPAPAPPEFDLTLFISGASVSSGRAVSDVRALCDLHLRDRHRLRIVDVYRDPDEAAARGVLATPTLIKEGPLPRRVLVGDLSDRDRVLLGLDIDLAGGPPRSEVDRVPDRV
jgi:circadian clock protein KaiB